MAIFVISYEKVLKVSHSYLQCLSRAKLFEALSASLKTARPKELYEKQAPGKYNNVARLRSEDSSEVITVSK